MKYTNLAVATGIAVALSASVASAADISGAGATFPAPIYAKWAEAYKAKTGVGVNYQQSGRIILAPMRTGVGLRAGANVGYLKFTPTATWNPF